MSGNRDQVEATLGLVAGVLHVTLPPATGGALPTPSAAATTSPPTQ
jgi:hypothetical protein